MQTILSQAAEARTAKAEGATTIPKGSRPQVGPKRGASRHRDEEIVWTCWRQQEGKWKRFTRNIFGFCFLQHNVYGNFAPRSCSESEVFRRFDGHNLERTGERRANPSSLPLHQTTSQPVQELPQQTSRVRELSKQISPHRLYAAFLRYAAAGRTTTAAKFIVGANGFCSTLTADATGTMRLRPKRLVEVIFQHFPARFGICAKRNKGVLQFVVLTE